MPVEAFRSLESFSLSPQRTFEFPKRLGICLCS